MKIEEEIVRYLRRKDIRCASASGDLWIAVASTELHDGVARHAKGHHTKLINLSHLARHLELERV